MYGHPWGWWCLLEADNSGGHADSEDFPCNNVPPPPTCFRSDLARKFSRCCLCRLECSSSDGSWYDACWEKSAKLPILSARDVRDSGRDGASSGRLTSCRFMPCPTTRSVPDPTPTFVLRGMIDVMSSTIPASRSCAVIIINYFPAELENEKLWENTNNFISTLLLSNILHWSHPELCRVWQDVCSFQILQYLWPLQAHLHLPCYWNCIRVPQMKLNFRTEDYHGLAILLISPSGESLSYFTAGMWRSNLNSESTILYFNSQQ